MRTSRAVKFPAMARECDIGERIPDPRFEATNLS